MSILMGVMCLLAGHNYRTIQMNDKIIIKECRDCGKIKKIKLY